MGPAEYLLNYRIKMAQKCYVQVVCLYNKFRRLLELQTLFILVEFSRSELAFRLLNIARSSSIIHTNVNRVHSYLKITVLYLWRVKGNIGLKELSLKSLLVLSGMKSSGRSIFLFKRNDDFLLRLL